MLRVEQHNPFNGVQRYGVVIFTHAHHERPVDADGERHAHDKPRAFAGCGRNADAAAKLFDFAVDDIEAHTATRNLGDCFGC